MYIVDLPPPVHGMSVINEKYINALPASAVINSAPSFLYKKSGSFYWYFFKFLIIINIFFKILKARMAGDKICYRSINGGRGQILDILIILFCRLFNIKLYIQHHSFAYLNCYSNLFRFLSFVAGKSAYHIVLGRAMKLGLIETYSIDSSNILIISNSIFFPTDNLEVSASRNSKVVLGHMANLTLEKGVGIFIDLCIELRTQGFDFNAVLAGPISGKGVNEKISEFSAISGFKYLGPLYGKAKEKFFSSLDFFIFPSTYINEAEPLVLYEATEYGAVIIVTDVGCLADVASSLGGYSFSVDKKLLINLVTSVGPLLTKYNPEIKSVVKLNLSKHRKLSLSIFDKLHKEISNETRSS